MSSESIHKSVLLRECVASLGAENGGHFLDCTFGGGGHARALLESNGENTVVAIDRDIRAVARGARDVEAFKPRLKLMHSSFSELATKVGDEKFDGVLADLGVSTDQIKEERGFSFHDAASLDMRMNETDGVTAADIVNTYSERDLVVLLKQGGVGPKATQVVKAIMRARPIKTAEELSSLVNKVIFDKKKNPSTVVFQAIRMAVNRELEEIESLMLFAPKAVKSGGRLSVITFHSLEDKAVTRVMRTWEGKEFSALWPGAQKRVSLGSLQKPVDPSEEEIRSNPSARSARLRIFHFN